LIGGYRVVAVTPARGGSRTVKYKNLRELGGRPLIAWPIATAQATPEIDRIIVSTDDERIRSEAIRLGAEVYDRPAELANDTAIVADVLRQLRATLAREGESADILVLLEATSPFRTPELVRRCLERLVDESLESIATFHAAEINPERAWRIVDGRPAPFIDGAVPWRPRQQLTPAYQLNGAVYAFFLHRLLEGIPNLLFGRAGAEIVDAHSVIDIDDERDFVIANALLHSGTIPYHQ
jgi:CMP-N,N'-diacetyllegionaminic acid synthase